VGREGHAAAAQPAGTRSANELMAQTSSLRYRVLNMSCSAFLPEVPASPVLESTRSLGAEAKVASPVSPTG
jgi:hypothetical protein